VLSPLSHTGNYFAMVDPPGFEPGQSQLQRLVRYHYAKDQSLFIFLFVLSSSK
jgi:hypothetical protein